MAKRETGRMIVRKLSRAMYDELGILTDAQLRMVLRALKSYTPTNCWWFDLRLAPAIREAVEAIRYSRTFIRRQERKGMRRVAKRGTERMQSAERGEGENQNGK